MSLEKTKRSRNRSLWRWDSVKGFRELTDFWGNCRSNCSFLPNSPPLSFAQVLLSLLGELGGGRGGGSISSEISLPYIRPAFKGSTVNTGREYLFKQKLFLAGCWSHGNIVVKCPSRAAQDKIGDRWADQMKGETASLSSASGRV